MSNNKKKGPGKANREGISILQMSAAFPDEEHARDWFEAHVWPDGRYCPRCGSLSTHVAKHPKSPYRCKDCRAYFSVKTGTALECSRIPLRKWIFAMCLEITSLKGVSSMKLHRDIGVKQQTAWFMLHRIREAWMNGAAVPFDGPVEMDETYMGGKKHNMSRSNRAEVKGRGWVGKSIIVGVKDRKTKKVVVEVVENVDTPTIHAFASKTVELEAVLYTDEAAVYKTLPHKHESVNHSAAEYVRGMAHTNGIESFWATLKRAHMGTYHKISKKHLHSYAKQFAGKQSMRELDTIGQMVQVTTGLVGRRLSYEDLTED